MKFIFKGSASRQLRKFDESARSRVLKKLQFFSSQKDPLKFAEPLKDMPWGGWRFRIGDYRVIFEVYEDTVVILKIGHRKDVYK